VRRAALTRRSAERVPVPSAVPIRHGHLPDGGAAVVPGRRRPHGRVLAPRPGANRRGSRVESGRRRGRTGRGCRAERRRPTGRAAVTTRPVTGTDPVQIAAKRPPPTPAN